MKTKSLIRRSVAGVLLAQLACAAVLCAAALLHEHHTRFRAFDTSLRGRSDSLLGAVQDAEDPDDNVTIDPAELKLPSQDVYAVYNKGGRLLGSSSSAPADLITRGADGYRSVRSSGTPYRVLQREALRIIDRAEYGGVGLRRPITIVYASPETRLWHEIREAAGYYLLVILVVTAAVALVVATLLRRALSPLTELASATASVAVPTLEFTPPPSALELRELAPLTLVLSDSISRLREFFQREQQFFGDAAHELKTAIAVVRSSTQLLLMKPRSDSEYAQGLEHIVSDTQRLETLVTQMLLLARVTEADPADSDALDLCEAVCSVVDALHPVAKSKGVTLHMEPGSAALVKIPRQSAETLASNLLLNAIQYSTAGSEVNVSVDGNAAGAVLLRVTDQGAGISAEALPHIFDRFYREDSSRSRETGGAGLGLAISKSIVDRARGSIQVESVKGVGTTMTVTFTTA